MRSIIYHLFFFLLLITLSRSQAQTGLYPPSPAFRLLGDRPDYRVPDGPKGWYKRGLMTENDGTLDCRGWFGLQLEVYLEDSRPCELLFIVKIPSQLGRHELLDSTTARLSTTGGHWQTLTVPLSSFDYNRGQSYFLKFVKEISVRARVLADGRNAALHVREMRLIKGNPLALEALIRSRPGKADSSVLYTASVSNSSRKTISVHLELERKGWETMPARVEPADLQLAPGESRQLRITVRVPAQAPQGSREVQKLTATCPENGATTTLEFITLRKLEGPYLVHQEKGWADVISKTERYDWARLSKQEYIRKADEFVVPGLTPQGLPSDAVTPAVFTSYLEQQFWPVAVAYKLTGDLTYARKLALLLLRLSDERYGYPKRLHANSAGIPQEGGFWEAIARSYDLIKDSGALTPAQRLQIEEVMRLYICTVEDTLDDGGISNWSVFNLCPAAQCALAIQDMYHFDLLLNAPCGIKDQLRYGTMDDGWWYEVTLSYNLGCANDMTSLGLAAAPFGIDILHEKVPVSLSKKVGLRPFEHENFLGMAFGKFGPIEHNYVTIKQMWEAIMIYPDHRSIMFGMGDGHEHQVGGSDFEKAYFAFRDTAFAAVVKQGGKRDLLYGVPELPANTPQLYRLSGHSDNAGIAVLRSQTPGRAPSEQIQAAIKYGAHGSYHGHFDRISLLSLMRYGKSFWNPETSWFGYGNYMYKWWVQPSMSHNMVVVDGKQQEPVESRSMLFYSGKMIQVMAAETKARWGDPPYFGGYDQVEKVERAEAPYVKIPPSHPKVGAVTDLTEPVLQRRVMIVTDDYVLLADHLKAERPHVFDNLLHLRGVRMPVQPAPTGHDDQFDANPLSSGQFITNVTNYRVEKPGKITSVLRTTTLAGWEPGGFNGLQEPGDMNIDVYHAWPIKAELRIGNYPEAYSNSKKLSYEVWGNGRSLVKDSIGTWILGRDSINIEVKGLKEIVLKCRVQGRFKNKTIFWANAMILSSKGKLIPLGGLIRSRINTSDTLGQGRDYKNGKVTIAGKDFADVIGAEPSDPSRPSEIRVDLSGTDAVRLLAVVGGDSPVGDEDRVRKTVALRTYGKEARFLTLIEPYEHNGMVKKVAATTSGNVLVELADGRTQKVMIHGLDSSKGAISVTVIESLNGKIHREETTSGTPGKNDKGLGTKLTSEPVQRDH